MINNQQITSGGRVKNTRGAINRHYDDEIEGGQIEETACLISQSYDSKNIHKSPPILHSRKPTSEFLDQSQSFRSHVNLNEKPAVDLETTGQNGVTKRDTDESGASSTNSQLS